MRSRARVPRRLVGETSFQTVARAQAVYFGVTGLWPLVSIRTFEAITGPKTDRWLVKTVGALVTAIGAALALASRRPRSLEEAVLLGAFSAASLGAVDVVYVARGRIAPIYLLDAAVELALITGWAIVWRDGTTVPGTQRARRYW